MTVTLSSRRLAALLLVAAAAAGCDSTSASAPAAVACTPEPATPGQVAALAAVASTAAQPSTPSLAGGQGPQDPRAPAPVGAGRDAASVSPTVAPARSAENLKIKRLILADGVKAREPADGGRSVFRDGETDAIFAFVEVENHERLPGTIVVSFESPAGPAVGNVRLPVGASPRWRTWASSRAIRGAGEWTAVVRDQEGRVLAREPFSVTL